MLTGSWSAEQLNVILWKQTGLGDFCCQFSLWCFHGKLRKSPTTTTGSCKSKRGADSRRRLKEGTAVKDSGPSFLIPLWHQKNHRSNERIGDGTPRNRPPQRKQQKLGQTVTFDLFPKVPLGLHFSVYHLHLYIFKVNFACSGSFGSISRVTYDLHDVRDDCQLTIVLHLFHTVVLF